MSKPNYRVMFNADCTWPIIQAPDPVTPEGVARVVDAVARGGADVFLVNPNAQKANYPSKVWEKDWDAFTPGDVSSVVCGQGEPQTTHDLLVKMKRLAEQCDYLAMMLARCRQQGLVPGVSIRMNDMHDAPWAPNTWMFSRFYREHPEYWIKTTYARGWAAKGLDYTHPEIRQHYLALIGEIVAGCDLEVMELDFSRFTCYFDRADPERNCAIMTAFIGDVRGLIRKSGKPIALIPRVAATPTGAHELGFDVAAWAERGLIDGLSFGNFLTTGWEYPVDAFRRLVGPDVGLYAYADHSAAYMDGLPPVFIHISREHQRGFAAGYRALGADGVATFNWYWGENYGMTSDEYHRGLGEMAALETLRPLPRRHLLSTGAAMADREADMPVQVPATLAPASPWPGCAHPFEMVLAAEAPGMTVTLDVIADGAVRAEGLWLRVNDRTVGHAVEVLDGARTDWQGKPYADLKRQSRIARYRLPNGLLVDGRNRLVLRVEPPAGELTVLGIEVRIA